MFWSFVSFKDDGADGAPHAFDFHYFVFENVPELLYVSGQKQSNEIIFACYLVEINETIELRKSRDYIIHLSRLHENVHKRQQFGHIRSSCLTEHALDVFIRFR